MTTRTGESVSQAEARILFVDSDRQSCSQVEQMLSLVGYEVEQATLGELALTQLEIKSYDLMLLETNLPDLNGVEVMDMARKMQPEMMIIVLTQNPTLESAISAVRAGAIDYLCKPMSTREVVQHVAQALHEQVVRRKRMIEQMIEVLNEVPDAGSQNGRVLAPGQQPEQIEQPLSSRKLELDPTRRLATLKQTPRQVVHLTRGETAVLSSLMFHAEKVLSCQQLASSAWGYAISPIEAESIIRPYIFRLRRKLEPNPHQPRLITTVRGRGYMFSAAYHEAASRVNHSK